MKLRILAALVLLWTPSAKADPRIAFQPFRWFPVVTVRTLPAKLKLLDGTTETGTLAEIRLNNPFRLAPAYFSVLGLPAVGLMMEGGTALLSGALRLRGPDYTFYPGEVSAQWFLQDEERVTADRTVLLSVPSAERSHLGSLFRGESQEWENRSGEFRPMSLTLEEEGTIPSPIHRIESIELVHTLTEEQVVAPKSQVQPVRTCGTWFSRLLK